MSFLTNLAKNFGKSVINQAQRMNGNRKLI